MAQDLGCFPLFSILSSMNDHGSSSIFTQLFPWGKFPEDQRTISEGYKDLQEWSQH